MGVGHLRIEFHPSVRQARAYRQLRPTAKKSRVKERAGSYVVVVRRDQGVCGYDIRKEGPG